MRYRKHASGLLLPEDRPRGLQPLCMGAPQQALLMNGASTISEAVAIYNALVAYWQFEENDASTSFLDSHGTNHLTPQTGTTANATSAVSNTGVVSRAFTPGATNDRTAFIPRSNTNLDLPNSDFTFGGWMQGNWGASSTTAFVMGRVGSGVAGSKIHAYLRVDATTDTYQAGASSDGSAVTSANSGVAPGNVWFFVTLTLDRTNNLIRIRVKNKAGGTTVNANVTAAFASALYTGASTSNFCMPDGLSSDNTYFSGTRNLDANAGFDQCFYATRALSDGEYDYLWNSGNGRTYAALKADAGH